MSEADRAARRERFAAAAREERPDTVLLCLLLAGEAGPAFDDTAIEWAGREFDRLAAQVRAAAAGDSPEAWAAALRDVLGSRLGFHGVPADYDRLASSLLPAVLRRRRGLPILLSVVWAEVGRRAGAPVHGVALPGHFVACVGDPAGQHVLVDPFAGGHPLTPDAAESLVARATGTRQPVLRIAAAEPLEIVARVLNNIRAWAAARSDQTATHLWAVECALLLPRHSARLRLERAQLLVERGDFLRGAAELESYAEVVAVVDPRAAEAIRHRARAARARLN